MSATLEAAAVQKAGDKVERAVPNALRQAKQEAGAVRGSIAARRSGLITGGVVFVVLYGLMARRRRLGRIEEKLDAVAEEVADDAASSPRED